MYCITDYQIVGGFERTVIFKCCIFLIINLIIISVIWQALHGNYGTAYEECLPKGREALDNYVDS